MNIAKLFNQAKNMMGVKPYHSNALSAVEREKEINGAIKFTLCASVASLATLEPGIAMATSNLTNVAQNVLTFITGPFGRTVATIAVVVLGLMAMFGKLAWDNAIKVILGIALVFGAGSIIDSFTSMTQSAASGTKI